MSALGGLIWYLRSVRTFTIWMPRLYFNCTNQGLSCCSLNWTRNYFHWRMSPITTLLETRRRSSSMDKLLQTWKFFKIRMMVLTKEQWLNCSISASLHLESVCSNDGCAIHFVAQAKSSNARMVWKSLWPTLMYRNWSSQSLDPFLIWNA